MAKEISNLATSSATLAGTELVHIIEGGNSRKATAQKIATTIPAATTSAAGKVERATVAECRDPSTDGKVPTVKDLYDAADEVALSSSSNSVAWDMDTGVNFSIANLGENTTIANPTNTVDGKCGYLRIEQDGTGSRTVAWGSNFEFAGGTAPTATTDANAEDMFFYVVISSTRILITSVLDIS